MRINSHRASGSAEAMGMIFQLANGNIQGCNQDAERLLGYTAQKMTEVDYFNPPWQTIARDGSPFAPETHPGISSIKTGLPYSDVVMGFYRSQENLVWLSVDSQPLFQANGTKPYGAVVTFREIAEHQANESPQDKASEWQPNRQFIGQLADAIPGVLSLYDAIAGRNIYVNSQAEVLWGYTPEEIIDLGAEFVDRVMHPEDIKRLPDQMAVLNRSQSGQVCEFEYRIRHKNGSWRRFCSQDRVYSRTPDGSIQQILSIAQDITDRKQTEVNLCQSEEHLKLATGASGLGMWFWDLKSDNLEWTEHCNQLFGLDANTKITYELFLNTLHPDDRDRTAEAVQQALANHAEYSIEYRAIWSDGSVHWIAAKGRGFYNPDGEPVRMMGTVQDITQRKQAEAELVKTDSILQSVIRDTSSIIFVKDLEGRYVIANQAGADILGISVKEMLGKDDAALFAPELAQSMMPIDRRVIDEGISCSYEEEIVNGDKSRSLLTNKYPWRDSTGKILGIIGICRDITAIKQSEQKLKEKEQLLQLALTNANAGSWNWEIATGKIVWSPENYYLYGLDPQQGSPQYQDWEHRLHPDDRERINREVQQVLDRELPQFNCEFRIVHPQRGVRWLLGIGNVTLDDNGKPIRLSGINLDITEREVSKQALQAREQELRLITEVIPQQIWTTLPNGEIDYVNQRWQEYTGISLAEIKSSGWSSIVHPDDLEKVNRNWSKAIETGGKYNAKTRLRKADGTYDWFLNRARPLRNQQGKIIKWYGTNTDISRIKQLEEKLRQQTKDLTKANQIKDEFLAIVSHELRTPLNPILGWAQLLAAGRLDAEKTSTGIAIIERNAKLQAQLIDDLLDVSRILRGKLNLKATPLNLESVIKSALTTVQLAADAKSIQIITEFEPNIGQVSGDAGRLQQIVWNLVSNAIKFTPETGQVTVKLEQVDQYALIQVIDTGQGIDPEFLPYVFDHFRQAESSTTRQFGGLGLGLAIVRHLTELHGGTVAVTSPGSGQGATFSVQLPLINRSTPKTLASNTIKKSVKPDRFDKLKVLVVDDETDSRDILTFVLEQEGAEVTPVASAESALKAFENSQFDLIVSDIGMPEVDGYTLIKQIRQLPQGKALPAIALTAYAGEIDQQLSVDAGYQKHITKPIDIPELIDIITSLVSG